MKGKFFRSKGFLISASVLLLLLVAAAMVPMLVSVDHFRPQITALIEEQTGRKAEIEVLELHIFPSIHLHVEDFRVKNPEGFPAGDTLLVEEIVIGAELRPLLDRRLQVTFVRVNGVQVTLLESQHGAINYDVARGTKKAQKVAEAADESPSFTLSAIESIEVRNVALSSGTYHTRRKEVTPAFEVTGINTTLTGLDLADEQVLRNVGLQVDLAGATISTPALTVPLLFEEGALTVKEGAGEGSFHATLDTLRVRGDLKVADITKPRADFNVTIPELDLLKLASLTSGGGNSSSKQPGRARRSPPQKKLLARGSVKIGKLLLPPLTAENFTSKIRLYTHKIDVNSFTLNFYDGSLEGTASLNQTAAGQPLTVKAKIGQVNIEQLVRAVAPDSKQTITGTFEASTELTTELARDPAATLRGNGNFAVRDGSIPGVDLRGTLVRLARVFQMDVPAGDTNFSLFGGDFRVQKQRVHSKQILLESDAVNAKLAGSFGFDGTLDYTGTSVLTGGDSTGPAEETATRSSNPLAGIGRALSGAVQKTLGTIGMFRVPVSLKGTFEDPKFRLAGTPQPIRGEGSSQPEAPRQEVKKSLLDLLRKKN